MQESLFHDEDHPAYMVFDIDDIDRLIPNARLMQIDPPAKMVESVRMYGILQPILVIANKDNTKYSLEAGRGRIAAARKAGVKTIPARVFSYGWTRQGVLTLVENEIRRRNPLAEWKSICHLMEHGLDETEICNRTGISAQKFNQLMSLNFLIPELKVAFEERVIKPSTAMLAAKQKPKLQRKLARLLSEEGKLHAADIARVRKIAKNEAVANLPFEIFEKSDWQGNFLAKIAELRASLPKNAEVNKALDALVDAVEKSGGK